MDSEKDNKITEEKQSDCFVVERDEVTTKQEAEQPTTDETAQSEQIAIDENSEPTPETTEDDDEPKYPRKNKKSNLWSNIFCIASIVATFVAMYFVATGISDKDNARPLWEVLADVNVKYLLLGVGTLLLMMLLDSLKYVVIMWANGVKPHYPTALKVSLLGKYYDNITPFSSGGQPMQIYYLHKKGLGGGKSSGIIMTKMAFNMLLWLLICCLLMVLNRGALDHVQSDAQRQTFIIMGWVGFGVNCFLPITILLFAIFPKMIEAITRWILLLGSKMKIVKDKDATFKRAQKGVVDFKNSFVSMLKKPLQTFLLVILCAVEPFLSMTLPYFAVVALANVPPSVDLMFEIMTLNVYVSMSATIIPTPGNMGAIETAFMMALTNIATGTLFWTVLGWRLLSFYSYILIGLVMTIVQIARQYKYKKTLA